MCSRAGKMTNAQYIAFAEVHPREKEEEPSSSDSETEVERKPE